MHRRRHGVVLWCSLRPQRARRSVRACSRVGQEDGHRVWAQGGVARIIPGTRIHQSTSTGPRHPAPLEWRRPVETLGCKVYNSRRGGSEDRIDTQTGAGLRRRIESDGFGWDCVGWDHIGSRKAHCGGRPTTCMCSRSPSPASMRVHARGADDHPRVGCRMQGCFVRVAPLLRVRSTFISCHLTPGGCSDDVVHHGVSRKRRH